MTAPVLVTPPAAPLVDLLLMKEHLRVTGTEEDFLIGELVKAAGQYLDGWGGILGRCILPQTWRVSVPAFADMALPFPDLQSAVVRYLDAAAAEQTLSAAAYRTGNDAAGGFILFDPAFALPAVADREDAVRIEAVFGFPATANIAGIRTAAQMIVAHWYDNRDGGSDIPAAASALLAPFRRAAI